MKKISRNLLLGTAVAGIVLLASGQHGTSEEKKEGGHAPALTMPIPPMSPVPRPENAELYIISPKDGDEIKGKFTVQFGLKGMGVAPAGIYMGEAMPTGHHHLVLDAELPDMKLPFPKDENNLHFGGGQTEVELDLPPGEHTLQLVLGDHAHVPHDPPLISEKITIKVVEE